MSRTVFTLPVEEAANRLVELVTKLLPGEEIALTSQNRPVARIVPQNNVHRDRRAGACQGMLTILQEDDEHLADFKEYMA